MKRMFCDNCKELVDVNVKEKKSKIKIKGKEYEYLELLGFCGACGEELLPHELNDENIRRMDEVYRKEENIITTEQISEILRKYKIGKKPLSKLLGWGEVTLTRYINGDVPTKPYSDELLKILEDSNYMLSILEKNKGNITEIAYKTAIKSIQNTEVDTITEVELVAQYLIAQCHEITPLALQKLLYYAQGFYKSFFDDNLFKSDCEAWIYGPVYNEIYDKYKKYGSANIEQDLEYDLEGLLEEDKKTLLKVIANCFGYYNGKALAKMTHYEQPWMEARKGILPEEKSNKIIEKESINDYFSKIREKYDMINILEIKKYSEDQFHKVIALCE